jgi:hypothetical protein
MNYPNKEQQVDKLPEALDDLHKHSQEKRNEESSSHAAVGELKWSKEHEKEVKETGEIEVSEQKCCQDKKGSVRMFQILWLPCVLGIVLITGLIIGHSILGGQPAGDVFDIKMWERLYHLVFR